jgi:hypothetical protein
MNLYFGVELPKEVIDCLYKVPYEQFGFHKETLYTVEDIIEIMKQACIERKVYIIYEKGIILFFTDQTPYVLHMDSVRSADSSIFDYTKVIKKAVKFFTENTESHKIETRTPFKELEILAKRCKWDHEGTHKQSYQMPSGEFYDELSFGIILKRGK